LLDDPKLELKVRENEPQTLDSALKSAQRLEVFSNAVKQRLHTRQCLSRHVTQSPNSRSDSIEERLAKIEQDLRKPSSQPDSQAQPVRPQVNRKESNVSKKRAKKDENKRPCATTANDDNAWKDELLKKVRELEVSQREAKVNTEKITAENDALNKEVDRLRHLE